MDFSSLFGDEPLPFPNDPRNVIVTKMAILVDGRDDVELDLTGNLEDLKSQVITMKEGSPYRIKIYFYVQRSIVAGLIYHQTTTRKGVRADKQSYVAGSYGPKLELQSYTTPEEEAPSGMMYRGLYSIDSIFMDDFRIPLLQWQWQFFIKKNWE